MTTTTKIVYHDKIEFDYVNWKGETSHRKVEVDDFYYGSNAYHQEPQWLMLAFDLEKEKSRMFAMKDMSNVKRINT